MKKDVNYCVENVDSVWVSLYSENGGSLEVNCRSNEGSEKVSIKLTLDQFKSLNDTLKSRLEDIERTKLKKAKELVNAESDD